MENVNQNGMTQLMYRYAADRELTLDEARAKLHADAYIRTVGETLAKYCHADANDPAALRKAAAALLLESDPSQKKDSVERKVRTWINSRAQLISRESAVQLAFALRLGIDDAEEMVCRLCGEGFHWRSPEDIICLFALEQGMSYTDYRALQTRLEPVYRRPEGGEDGQEAMTAAVRQQAEQIETEAELEAFLRETAPQLGTMHNTAYRLYMDFMELLKSASIGDLLPEERKMSVSEIVSTYLYNRLIPRANRSADRKEQTEALVKDAIQRDIQLNWPDEFVLARMTSRETDVTRKVLILLFLACDGGDAEDDYSDDSEEEVFEDTSARLNSMLADCGFAPLDSRIPFDWMVLYCLAADDSIEVDEKITRFLTEIFRPSAEEENGEA